MRERKRARVHITLFYTKMKFMIPCIKQLTFSPQSLAICFQVENTLTPWEWIHEMQCIVAI